MMGRGVIKNKLISSGQIQHYTTINEIIFAKRFGDTHHLCHINKLLIVPQQYYQH